MFDNETTASLLEQEEEDEEEGGTTLWRLPLLADVLNCQFSRWYPIFSNLSPPSPPPLLRVDPVPEGRSPHSSPIRRHRRNVTIPSVVLSLPESFRVYLQTDGIHLPKGAQTTSGFLDQRHRRRCSTPDSDDDEDDDDNDDDSGDDDDELLLNSFVQLNQNIEEAIHQLGSDGVMPKLNWSAPKDAAWINGGTMQCKTPGDIYLLLKASDFCSYDVNYACVEVQSNNSNNNHNNNEDTTTTTQSTSHTIEASNTCDDPAPTTTAAPAAAATTTQPPLHLVLRKWCKLYPSQEFRCFLSDHRLLAISQRHTTQHWPHLMEDANHYRSVIMDFCQSILVPNVPTDLVKYVADLYIDQQDRVWLLDLNVWASRTDSLLFDWPELEALAAAMAPSLSSSLGLLRHDQHCPTSSSPSGPECNEGDDHDDDDDDDDHNKDDDIHVELRLVESARQIQTDPLASYRAPIDTVHLASMNEGDATKFQEFMDLCRTGRTSDDDDDNDH